MLPIEHGETYQLMHSTAGKKILTILQAIIYIRFILPDFAYILGFYLLRFFVCLCVILFV